MKIATIVGVRGAGKTTVLESLLRELSARGLAVGTAKSVFCPTFHMDKPGSNTYRHTKAGALAVAARGETETTILFPRRLRPSEWLAFYTGFDWVLCEGDYELPVPRIVAAHGEDDARERLNSLTLAVSGRIANVQKTLDGLPVLHPGRDIAALADLLIRQTPDAVELSALDVPLRGADIALSRAFCAQGCKGHQHDKKGIQLTVNGQAVPLTREQEDQILAWLAAGT